MDKVVEYAKWVWTQVMDHPGAVLTGVLVAIVALVLFRVAGFLAGIGG